MPTSAPPDLTDAPRLLAEIARVSKANPFERKFLVCPAPAEGRELLRSTALGVRPWMGWEVVTPRRLAHDVIAAELASGTESVADDFDVTALLDDAIDEVAARGKAGPFAERGGVTTYRSAIHRSIESLRLAGITPAVIRQRRAPKDGKLLALAAILEAYAGVLAREKALDSAAIFLRAEEAVNAGRSGFPEGSLHIVPGHALRGIPGRFIRLLIGRGGARVLQTDAVQGLPPPPGVLWAAPERSTAPLSRLHAEAPCPEGSEEGLDLRLFAAATPLDELREVLRRVTAEKIPWDRVEIVASERNRYSAALDSLSRGLDLPVTFAVGLDSRRTRVGRAVSGYFRWISEDFPSEGLRVLLETGDLEPPAGEGGTVTGAALARRLRRLRIGWGAGRYRERIRGALDHAMGDRAPRGGEDAEEMEAARLREIRELKALRDLVLPILDRIPELPRRGSATSGRTSPAAIAQGLLAFLEHVPAGDEVENSTRQVVQRRLGRALRTLTREAAAEAAIGTLEARLGLRVAPVVDGRPAPWTSTGGRLHLSDFSSGGMAHRPFTFVVGLDALAAGGGAGTDPLLSDADRRRLSGGAQPAPLAGAGERADEARHRLAALFARLRGRVTLSYSAWDRIEGRAVSPAPELLQALRLREGRADLSYDDLRTALGPLACAVPRESGTLDNADVWLDALGAGGVLRAGTPAVRAVFDGLDRGLAAGAERRRPEVTAYHGRIGTGAPSTIPRAGKTFSASRLEALGQCPRRYFYRYELGLRPVQDPEWDPGVWLDAGARGKLLHTVFERSLREAREGGISEQSETFAVRVLEILEEEAGRARARIPEPGPRVYEAELDALRSDVRSFFRMIAEQPPRWIDLELQFGPGELPVSLDTPLGEVQLRGAIDRIDELAPGCLRVVDYKTGSSGRFRPGVPFDGGRRIQHFLYSYAAGRLRDGSVERMEYHFPTTRGENQVVTYRWKELSGATEVVAALFGILSDRHFMTTENPADCMYCDFKPVCRAKVDSHGAVACEPVRWMKETGMDLPENARLVALREADRSGGVG